MFGVVGVGVIPLSRRHWGLSLKAHQRSSFLCSILLTLFLWLAILLCHYSGGKWAIESARTAAQARLGWRWDASKSQLQMSSVCWGFSAPWEAATLWPGCAATKFRKFFAALQAHRTSRRITSADASSLHGSFNWVRSTFWGCSRAAVLAALRLCQRSSRTGLNTALAAMLDWLEHVLWHANGREISCDFAHLELAVTISDGDGTGNVAAGLWVPSRFRPEVATTAVPQRLLDKWALRAQAAIGRFWLWQLGLSCKKCYG